MRLTAVQSHKGVQHVFEKNVWKEDNFPTEWIFVSNHFTDVGIR